MSQEKIPFQEGLFTEGGPPALLASRCRSCGRVFFPRRNSCLECSTDKPEAIELTGPAKLYTHTTVMMPVHKYKPPFTLVWAEFPENIRVMGQLTGGDAEPQIGMDLELVIDALWSEEDKQIIGYKFQPKG